MSASVIETLILLALPASGKSEVRHFLEDLGSQVCYDDFGLGALIHLDDYPYVQAMIDLDKICRDQLEIPGIFFQAPDKGFVDPMTWLMLIEFLNQDYEALVNWEEAYGYSNFVLPDGQVMDPAHWLFERFDRAAGLAGAKRPFAKMKTELVNQLAEAFQDKAQVIFDNLWAKQVDKLDGHTVIIEFSRGGPEGATMPLDPPHGYEICLGRLNTRILAKAKVLYVKVSVEESIRRDEARAVPPPGQEDNTELFHGLSPWVRQNNYSCDDFFYLLDTAACLHVRSDGWDFTLDVAVFDNDADLTSFIRDGEPDTWPIADQARLHNALDQALKVLS